MDKNELEYNKIRHKALRFGEIIGLVKYAIGCLTFVVALWLIFEGLTKVIGSQGPDGITAIAKVIDALKFGSVMGYIFGGGCVIAWRRERSGKKRAIKEKSRYQKIVEAKDSNRTSSGLNETGETPKEDDDD